jgi:uncharacterized protein YigA (DUF484 family)
MADPKSTNEIQSIAQGVVALQERVCQVKSESIRETMSALTATAQANSKAITDLLQAVAVLAETIRPFSKAIEANEAEIKANAKEIVKLTRRPAFWAAVGSALPVLGGVLWELVRSKP